MPSSTHTPEYRAIIRRVVAAREAAGFTQRDVAKRLGWPQSRVANIETCERRVDVLELMILAKLYRKSLMYFVRER